MKHLYVLAAASVLMTAAACSDHEAPSPTPAGTIPQAATVQSPTLPHTPATAAPILLEAGALRVGGQTFVFDTPAQGIREAVSALRQGQSPEQGASPECGPGPLDYARWDDLTLWFQNDRFVGWEARGPNLMTASGAHAGMTRPELEATGASDFEENTLGTGFAVGEVFGIIGEGETTAAVLSSGANCFAA